ncbi:MAG: HEAT repeat domain-containing protein [Chloroflexi bacterium]|nr:HEAT repeat domain-containing protein [Chloroflexota bacterium]
MTLDNYFSELTDTSSGVNHAGLIQLSGLERSEIIELMGVWSTIPVERRREIMDRMSELSEDNLDLDFASVFRACLRDKDDQVRAKAARGLEDSDDRTIIRPLIDLLLNDGSLAVRASAAASLGKFAIMAQDGKMLKRDAERIRLALVEVINNEQESLETKRRAIESVASFNSPQIEEIIQRAYDDGDPELKQSAIYAMGRSSDTRWMPTVIQDTRSSDPAVRYEAAIACGNLGDEETSPHVVALLNDDDSLVQLASVRALGVIGGGLAKRALQQCLLMGDDAMEEAAKEALLEIEFDDDPLNFSSES